MHQLTFGELGTADGEFDRPTGIAIDSADNIYVAGYYNHRIQVFNNAGIHQLTFGAFGYNR